MGFLGKENALRSRFLFLATRRRNSRCGCSRHRWATAAMQHCSSATPNPGRQQRSFTRLPWKHRSQWAYFFPFVHCFRSRICIFFFLSFVITSFDFVFFFVLIRPFHLVLIPLLPTFYFTCLWLKTQKYKRFSVRKWSHIHERAHLWPSSVFFRP